MKINTKKEIEVIFRNSNSPDELFDVFRIAISSNIKDGEMYKTLLWNKALSLDEIVMYSKKICKEFPEARYKIKYTLGEIYESNSVYGIYNEKAMEYYLEAASEKQEKHEPYLAIAKLYNNEIDAPTFQKVINAVKSGIDTVHLKSKLCFALSKLYKKRGMADKEREYQSLGEKYQKELQ